jgi:signal transduction histidine kinase
VVGLAEEQAALRRVATLVAQGRPQEEVFAAVIEEVARLLAADLAVMGRYESGATFTSVARSGGSGDQIPVGSRWKLGGRNLATIVFSTGRPARVDGYADSASDSLGSAIDEAGIRSSVATPITVEGQLWGVICAGWTLRRAMPTESEARLSDFTELVATAIANAESQAGLARLAEEQAALRRIATLVAQGVPPQELFAAVVEAIGRLLPVDLVNMCRYEPDRTQVFIATWGQPGKRFPLGSRRPLGGRNIGTMVFESGRPARIESYADASGPVRDIAREVDLRSAVGTPIFVQGRLWGLIGVGSSQEQPLPPDIEARLESFTELLVTAIANAESQAGLSRLAEEQAALRRIATLVAQGVPPEQVFAAVTAEIERLLPVDFAHLGRYDSDGALTIAAAADRGTTRVDLNGRSFKLGGDNLATLIVGTGRPARIDDYADNASGPLADAARQAGICSAAGTPIVVGGRIWGLMVVGSMRKGSLPADIELRLASFTELVAMAIANAEGHAALAASRTRIVTAADESRRRIERDLHDGAQQRLVHAVIVLRLALRALSNPDADVKEMVTEALQHAEQANEELRELAHGILPAALTRGGLRAGVEALLSRVSLPVRTEVSVDRLPAGVEATAYFVISEALTNVLKHAHAASADVIARVEDGELVIEVRDDGVGGARGDHGTGLVGLEDRVFALDGRFVVESPPGGGTRVCALLPLSDL